MTENRAQPVPAPVPIVRGEQVFLRAAELWLEVYDFNKRARRSYDKCGFTLEGVQRRAVFKPGRYLDVELRSILRDEWAAQPRTKSWEHGQ